jgi:hypothetical protein
VCSVNLFTTPVHTKGEETMKKKLYALSGVFLIVLVVAGLWATKAINITDVEQAQAVDPVATSPATGMSMEQMAQEAAVIVIGKCTETRSEWSGRSLVTLATISVTETLKGAPDGTEVTVVLPGGIDANRKFKVAMTYAGAPQLTPGEEAFLFLGLSEVANSYSVTGFAQGKFSIGKTRDGEPVVTRDMTMVPLQKGAGMTRGNPQAIPLPEFKAWVNSYLK